jgi:hypothetical protein
MLLVVKSPHCKSTKSLWAAFWQLKDRQSGVQSTKPVSDVKAGGCDNLAKERWRKSWRQLEQM